MDGAIKSLLPLAQAPTTSYPELIRSDSITLLVGLLSHENVDIVIDVVEVLQELTDEDVGNGGEDDDEREAAEEALKLLIESLVSRVETNEQRPHLFIVGPLHLGTFGGQFIASR